MPCPTFADSADCTSSPARYVTTRCGCLDTSPIGTTEKIIPYGLGTGPSNFALNLHVSKVLVFAFVTRPVRLAVGVFSHFLTQYSYPVELLILHCAAGLAIAVPLNG